MPGHSLLYYITDRTQFPGSEGERRQHLLVAIAEAARSRVDFIQLREKDLSARELQTLASEALRVIRKSSSADAGPATRLLINSRLDVCLAVGASGVHFRSDDISIAEAREIVADAAWRKTLVIAASCHSVDAVRRAASEKADFVVFAPIFENKGATDNATAGLESLAEMCRIGVPVLALGGVTLENAAACIHAGAVGVAGIRLFQQGSMRAAVERLRSII